MNQLMNTTASAPASAVSIPNDTRFDDLRKDIKSQGALVKKAAAAGAKALDALPTVADFIVRNSRDGVIDLVTQPDATTILHRDYCEAKGKPSKAGKSEVVQVSKLDAFYYLGTQKAFNGEEAFNLVKRLFDSAKKTEHAAKEKNREDKAVTVPGPYESKFNAYLAAARFINDNASANPPKYPRLDANNVSDTWLDTELPDDEIIESMERSISASKDAKTVLGKIVKSLEALVKGTHKCQNRC